MEEMVMPKTGWPSNFFIAVGLPDQIAASGDGGGCGPDNCKQ